MSDKKSWYSTGYDGVDREKERIARAGGPNRYWMKEGTTREVVFIDDEPLCVYEHQWRANGHWRNTCTCLKDTNDITPCCEKLGEKSRSFVGFYTAVDCTKHTDSKGNSYQFEVKLFPAKLKTLGVLRRKKESKGSLIGAMFRVTRDTSDDPNCGNDFEFVREADLEKLFAVANYRGKKLPDLYKEAAEKPDVLARLKEVFQLSLDSNGVIVPKIFPFNYYDLLAPKDPKEVRAMLGSYVPEAEDGGTGGGGGAGYGSADDSIPF